MEESICGADCENCGLGRSKGCRGCIDMDACPFGKECFIARYIKTGGRDGFDAFVKKLCDEINSLHVEGLPEVTTLFPMNGEYVNLAYPIPSGEAVKFLDGREVYLANQLECTFEGVPAEKCFGIVAGMDFILIVTYGENGCDPELVVYRKR